MKAEALLRRGAAAVALVAFGVGIALHESTAFTALFPPRLVSREVPLKDFDQLERFGSVEALSTEEPVRGLVVLPAAAADAAATREDAEALARDGLVTVRIDLDAFRRSLAEVPEVEECHYVSDDLKGIAQAVHRALGIGRYFRPVVAGRGEAAAFAYAALAQAPDNTLAGAVSLGFEPTLKSDRPFCFEPRLDRTDASSDRLRPEPALPAPWHVIAAEADAPAIEAFQRAMPETELLAVRSERQARRALVESALRLSRSGEWGTSGLPVAVIRPDGPAKALAVVVSGDGGWRDIDKTIGELLARQGVAIVGLDALRYFWSKKDPVQVAADLGLLFDEYGRTFGVRNYALIGFSFGADVVPDVWPLLPKATRGHIRSVSLLGLGLTADFEITVAGFVGAANADSRPLAPLLRQLPLDRTQCIYGRDEVEAQVTSCLAPELGSAERVVLDGGHRFDGDYARVADAIWRCLEAGLAVPEVTRATDKH